MLFVFTNSLGMIYSQNTTSPYTPVIEEYYGLKIVDEYRNLEDLKDPITINWMKQQTNYANKILNEIPNRQYYLNKRLEYDGKKSFSVNNINITENDLYFYLKKNPVENSAKLFFRKGFVGKEIELFDPLDYKKEAKDVGVSSTFKIKWWKVILSLFIIVVIVFSVKIGKKTASLYNSSKQYHYSYNTVTTSRKTFYDNMWKTYTLKDGIAKLKIGRAHV